MNEQVSQKQPDTQRGGAGGGRVEGGAGAQEAGGRLHAKSPHYILPKPGLVWLADLQSALLPVLFYACGLTARHIRT